MERITIVIDTDNSAFEDEPAYEVARILRKLADDFERQGVPPEKIYDINGNACGTCKDELK